MYKLKYNYKKIITNFWIFIANFLMLFSNRFRPTHLRNYAFRQLGMKIGKNVIIDKKKQGNVT